MASASLRFINQQFHIAGVLSFNTVMPLLLESQRYVQQTDKLVFDFAEVTSSDSAGLALIVEWVRMAKQYHKPVAFHHLSNELQALANVSSLDQVMAHSSL